MKQDHFQLGENLIRVDYSTYHLPATNADIESYLFYISDSDGNETFVDAEPLVAVLEKYWFEKILELPF